MTKGEDPDPTDRIIVHVDEDLEEIVPNFLKNRSKDVESIPRALDSGDFETIRYLGHGMKGSGAGYGFDEISRIGKHIEAAAMERNTDEIRKTVRELSTWLDRVEVVYD